MTEPKEVFSVVSTNLATMSLSGISANLAPTPLAIGPHNRPLLTFYPDGTISVADHVSANDAAKGFIDALSDEFGEMLARVKAEAIINTEAENAALREKLRYIANGCEGRIDKDSIPALIAKDALTGGDNAEG